MSQSHLTGSYHSDQASFRQRCTGRVRIVLGAEGVQVDERSGDERELEPADIRIFIREKCGLAVSSGNQGTISKHLRMLLSY